jgi:predicted short-subunit dehydrogenase-like oxidoreductase (DUF2520 family)
MSGRRRAAIIGPGRVGTLLAHALSASGTSVVQLAGGSDASRAQLRAGLAGVRDVPVERAADGVQLVVIATPDAAIAQVVDVLVRADALDASHHVVHLAGVHGLAPLRRAGLAGARIAACHPAVTVPAGATDPTLLHGSAWAVTAPTGAEGWVHELVRDLGGDPFDVPDSARVLYHAALATASNAVGAAAVTARRLLVAAGVTEPDRLLAPLATSSLAGALAHGAPALTGPVVRGDAATVAAHLAAMTADLPEVADAYRALSKAVLDVVRPALDATQVAALEDVLRGPDAEVQP